MPTTAHVDTFVRDRLPPAEQQAVYLFELPELQYPERLNAGQLLDRVVEAGRGDAPAIVGGGVSWSYGELQARANQVARILAADPDFETGNRVLLHGSNVAWAVAAWFGVVKAGGVVVATMPLLRAPELTKVIDKGEITHAIADASLREAVEGADQATGRLKRIWWFGNGELEAEAAAQPATFENVATAADDPVLIAFTSGTTGVPKGCIHFHRDVFAMADTFSRHVLEIGPDEVVCGTPPFAFTFGLGGLVIFPIAAGATIAILDQTGFDGLCAAIERHRVTTLFTAPTGYRALLKLTGGCDLSSLRKCVSAGEALPRATSDAWFEATGLRIIDGIGATEMIHVFISAAGDDIRPGATGKAVPGYTAQIQDDEGNALPPGSTGRLAVRGPTGCRYLDDPRQAEYVRRGWNMTGDLYRLDEDGYFWFVSRADDMIVSAGYNIGAPEVENALLLHDAVAEAAVIGVPDEERGQIAKAFVVLAPGHEASDALRKDLQTFVKSTIAPYKYPRAIDFLTELPKTGTGKLQRFKLKDPA